MADSASATVQRIAVTGAHGYVGGAIAQAASAHDHDVIPLVRSPAPGTNERPYDLSAPIPDQLLSGVEVVIHCAYDLKATRAQDIQRLNVEGTRRLIDASGAVGARFVLISSMSAYAGTRQLYGRAKLASEAHVLSSGGHAVRLGLVYGGPEGGMISSLTRLAGLPAIPVIGASSHQFMVHVDDMARAVVSLLEHPELTGQLAGLAAATPVAFSDLLRALARDRARRPLLVPIPWQPVYVGMRIAEAIGVSLPLRADSVLGLVRPAHDVPNTELWEQLGATVRDPNLDEL